MFAARCQALRPSSLEEEEEDVDVDVDGNSDDDCVDDGDDCADVVEVVAVASLLVLLVLLVRLLVPPPLPVWWCRWLSCRCARRSRPVAA